MAIAIVLILTPKYDFNAVKYVDVYSGQGCDIAGEELTSHSHGKMEVEQFKSLVSDAEFRYSWQLWKGAKCVVLKFDDDSIVRLAVSNYGCFFIVKNKIGYYFIKPDKCKEWEKAINRTTYQ